MTNQRQQLIRNIVGRGRAAMAWLGLTIVLIFAALARPWHAGALNGLLFAIGIGAAIALTRVWNLLDEARDLQRLESAVRPEPVVARFGDEPTPYR